MGVDVEVSADQRQTIFGSQREEGWGFSEKESCEMPRSSQDDAVADPKGRMGKVSGRV